MAPRKGSANDERLELKLDFIKEQLEEHTKNISGRLDKVDVSFGKMDDRLDKIDTVSSSNTAILEEHMRRTDLLEKRIEQARRELDDKLAPVQAHVNQMKVFLKIAGLVVGGTTALGGAGMGVKKLIEIIFGG